ncbi:MAG: pyridoxamine 5'-phosphate oxidase family protein [Polyangiales bacterium]
MGKTFDRIDDDIRGFMESQRLFFVATAPLDDDGLINVSPKGLDGTFAVVDEQTVAYLDLTGSGVETIAHVKENGRICLMFCAFEGRPRIIRIHGRGTVVERGDRRFADAIAPFHEYVGARSVVRVEATRISESCGFGVPEFEFRANRDQLTRWADQKGEAGVLEYQAERNAASLDGLPGVGGGVAGPD